MYMWSLTEMFSPKRLNVFVNLNPKLDTRINGIYVQDALFAKHVL